MATSGMRILKAVSSLLPPVRVVASLPRGLRKVQGQIRATLPSAAQKADAASPDRAGVSSTSTSRLSRSPCRRLRAPAFNEAVDKLHGAVMAKTEVGLSERGDCGSDTLGQALDGQEQLMLLRFRRPWLGTLPR